MTVNASVYELYDWGRNYIGQVEAEDTGKLYHKALEKYGSPIEIEVQ